MYFNQYFLPFYQNVNFEQYSCPQFNMYQNFLEINPYFYHSQVETINKNNEKQEQNQKISSKNQQKMLQSNQSQEFQLRQSHQIPQNQLDSKKEKQINHISRRNFKQKEGRNIISNVFRQFLKHILNDKEGTLKIIDKISKKESFQINVKNKHLKNYVRIGQVYSFLQGNGKDKSKNHAKIIRILLRFYLKQNMVCSLCWNTKINNLNRRLHIAQSRKFFDLIKN